MRAPYGLEIIETCLKSPHQEQRLFCDLSPTGLQRLAAITSASSYPKGATLFLEGEPPRGVFTLCNGKVKLSTTSASGRTLVLRITDVGEVLGLAAVVSGREYQATADVLEPTQVKFISRNEFLSFIREHGETALRVAEQLAENYHHSLTEMRTIGLYHSVGAKLARFLLDWTAKHHKGAGEIRVTLDLTHDEIAEMIGASRESVSRHLADFKKMGLLEMKHSTLIIRNKAGLEHLLGSSGSTASGHSHHDANHIEV